MDEDLKPTGFSCEIVSTPERDDLYAELNFNGVQWGEMCESVEKRGLLLKIYFVEQDTRRVLTSEFEVDGFTQIIQRARKRLLAMQVD